MSLAICNSGCKDGANAYASCWGCLTLLRYESDNLFTWRLTSQSSQLLNTTGATKCEAHSLWIRLPQYCGSLSPGQTSQAPSCASEFYLKFVPIRQMRCEGGWPQCHQLASARTLLQGSLAAFIVALPFIGYRCNASLFRKDFEDNTSDGFSDCIRRHRRNSTEPNQNVTAVAGPVQVLLRRIDAVGFYRPRTPPQPSLGFFVARQGPVTFHSV